MPYGNAKRSAVEKVLVRARAKTEPAISTAAAPKVMFLGNLSPKIPPTTLAEIFERLASCKARWPSGSCLLTSGPDNNSGGRTS